MDTSSLDDSFERLLLNSDKEDEIPLNNTDDQDELFENSNDSSNDDTDDDDTDDDDENDASVEDIWSTRIQKPVRFKFSDTFGITNAANNCHEPINFYQLFVSDELLEFIVHETNRYGNQKSSSWIKTTVVELKKFFCFNDANGSCKIAYTL